MDDEDLELIEKVLTNRDCSIDKDRSLSKVVLSEDIKWEKYKASPESS